MPQYQARPGCEDRHGEMTGAITVNMVMCMPLILIWAIWIGPRLLPSTGWVVVSALALAVVMPLACLFPSQWIWARISAWMDHQDPGADTHGNPPE